MEGKIPGENARRERIYRESEGERLHEREIITRDHLVDLLWSVNAVTDCLKCERYHIFS